MVRALPVPLPPSASLVKPHAHPTPGHGPTLTRPQVMAYASRLLELSPAAPPPEVRVGVRVRVT